MGSAWAQSFVITPTQVEITLAPGFNYATQRVSISGTAPGFDFASLSVSSSTSWVSPAIDPAAGEIVLTFQTRELFTSTNTATVTVSGAGTTDSFVVAAATAPLNIVKLKRHPFRQRIYGIHQNGILAGSLVSYDPETGAALSCVGVGRRPADLAISANGEEALVINCVDKTITAVDLETFLVKETISLPAFDNMDVNETTADVAYGADSIVYYTDGGQIPTLRVLDRATGLVIQDVTHNSFGIGAFQLTPDGQSLVASTQVLWTYGNSQGYLVRYAVGSDGRLTALQSSGQATSLVDRDVQNAEVFLLPGEDRVVARRTVAQISQLDQTIRTFPRPVFAVSAGGTFVATDTTVYEYSTGLPLLKLPVAARTQAFTREGERLVYFDRTARALRTVDLRMAAGAGRLGFQQQPEDGAVVSPPSELKWAAVSGAERYRVYLGATAAEVEAATPVSPLYLRESAGTTMSLPAPLTAGNKYFWRVDPVDSAGKSWPGEIYEFTVSRLAPDRIAIQTATVQGHDSHRVEVQLIGAGDVAWQASSNQPWLTLTTASGTGPARLPLTLDASQLAPGQHAAEVTVTVGGQESFILPVKLEVAALWVWYFQSSHDSPIAYAVSAGTASAPAQFLLELDCAARKITRTVPIGSSVTDYEIHQADGKIYVSDSASGDLLAIDRTTFQPVGGFSFIPLAQVIGTGNDAGYLAAGGMGRLIVEPASQYSGTAIYDLSSGIAKRMSGVSGTGSGSSDVSGRYYYRMESGLETKLRKYDLTGDVFTLMASASAGSSASGPVVLASNGNRIFWNKTVYRPDLTPEWNTSETIYATSADGRLAFGRGKIFDVNAQQAVLDLPVSSPSSLAYNSATGCLIVSNSAGGLSFFPIDPSLRLAAPSLAVAEVSRQSVRFSWTKEWPSASIYLEARKVGTDEWKWVPVWEQTEAGGVVMGLESLTAFEFRAQFRTASARSDWSSSVAATTGSIEVPALQVNKVTAETIALSWTDAEHETAYKLEMRAAGSEVWREVAFLDSDVTEYTLTGLLPGQSLEFRIRAQTAEGSSDWSTFAVVTTLPEPTPKLIYKLTGKFQQLGDSMTVSLPLTGYFIWDPETYRGVQIVAMGPAKVGFFSVYEDQFPPRWVKTSKTATIMVLPSVGASGPDYSVDDLESNFLRGTATNLKVGTTAFFVPRAITGKGWVVGRMSRGDYLLDTTETYSLDVTGSATSNKNKETINQVVWRIRQQLLSKGYEDLSE